MSNLTDRLGGARGSLAFKAPCRVATTANITLSGWQTIDGVAMASTDADNGYNIRVLVKNQTTASENGIYEPSTGAWSRVKDMDGSLDIVCGSRVFVAGGLTGSGGYVITTADPITIGTSSLTFTSQTSVDISFGSLAELTVPDPAADLIPIVDASAGTLKNIKYQTLAKYNSDGTAALPAIAFESDLDSGMYRIGANNLGWSVGGSGTGVGLSATALYPITTDGIALGTSSLMFADLFLASGAVINFNAGDVTITHSANALAFAGASSDYTFDSSVKPSTNGVGALGSNNLSWSDLFLAEGGVINWGNGDVTITQIGNVLSFAGASSDYTFDSSVKPSTNDVGALGSNNLSWSDLFLASGAVINFNNGDVTVTHSANTLAFGGAASGYTFDALTTITSANASALAVGANGATNPVLLINAATVSVATGISITGAAAASRVALAAISSGTDEGLSIDAKGAGTIRLGATSTGAVEFSRNAVPTASDGAALGTSSLMWSDAFFASGAVINFNNGDVTVTHSTDLLAFAGAASGYTFDGPTVIGNTAALAFNGLTTNHQVLGATEATASMTLGLFDSTGSEFPRLQFYRSKNASIGSATVVASGDVLGAISWIGAQQTGTFATQNPAARIRAEVDGTVTSGGSGDMPGRIVWATTPDGSGTLTDRMILDSSGALKPASNGGTALGTSALMWSNLFVATGGVINFNNGNYTLTHSAGNLTAAGGPFTAPSFIPSSTSVPTNGLYLPAANTLGWAINSSAKMQLTSAALSPAVSGGAALGTTALMWANAFFASGAVINFNNGDVTITHSTDQLALAGAASGYSVDAKFFPASNGGAALGDGTHAFSNLFLNTGGVVNFNNGDAVLTHSSGALAVTAGTFDIQKGWKLSGSYSDSWAGNQDNYNGGGNLASVSLIRVDGGAADRSITGMTGGSDGLIRILTNVGASNNIVLKNETTSTAANRFSLGSDVTLAPSQGAVLRYDGTLTRWTAVGVFTSVGAGSGTVTSVASGFGMNFNTITTSGTVALNAGLSAAVAGAF